MHIKPLFIYAGGKTRLIKHYRDIFPTNFDTYIETHAGGLAMFAYMKSINPDARFIVNDLNEELIALYKNIRDDCELFIECVKHWQTPYMTTCRTLFKKHFYYGARQEYWNVAEKDLFEVQNSALLYFLLRTSFNGIWQTCQKSFGRFGTPAGLLNQKVEVFSPDLVRKWSNLLQNVEIRSGDAISLDIPGGLTIIFADPPFRGGSTYSVEFNDEHQKQLVAFLKEQKERGIKSFLANKDCGDRFFEELLPDSKFHRFPITYTAGRRKHVEGGFEAKKAIELLMEI